MLSQTEARHYLGVLTKARRLVMIDEGYAHSPFPYDKNFLGDLRKDQVPRFLRCLTDPQKLPPKVFRLDDLWCIQNRVEMTKVESIMNSAPLGMPTVVKTDEHHYIVDGLHRLSADWLMYREETACNYCDLTEKTHRVEPVPGAGRFDSAEERARG